MEILTQIIDLFLHLDVHLAQVTQDYGTWTYAFLFLVIFLETGVVVTPFLPGDSLLFAAGAIAALDGSSLNVGLLFALLFAAAVLGDTVNYWIGNKIGPRVFEQNSRFLKREYPGVLCQTWRQNHHFGPFCSYCPYLRPLCRRCGNDVLW